MGQPHKHAALIKAWADGAEIELKITYAGSIKWVALPDIGIWHESEEYRIKPIPKVKKWRWAYKHKGLSDIEATNGYYEDERSAEGAATTTRCGRPQWVQKLIHTEIEE